MAETIDGKKISGEILKELKAKVAQIPGNPGLAVILVGDDKSSHLYVSLKEKACKKAGINFQKFLFPKNTKEQEVINKIKELNKDPSIHGILVQIPLPRQINENKVIESIDPDKDVDGFHPTNLYNLITDDLEDRLIPCVAQGIMKLLESTQQPWVNKKAVIVSNSQIFAIPIMQLLHREGIYPIRVSADDPYLNFETSRADILIVAVGQPNFIKADMVKFGSTIIDIGCNKFDNRTTGDVDFTDMEDHISYITPVPGGVGPMTIALLLTNVVAAFARQN
ncbi:bifunctional 5,10-methylene-tetrahydrofolate dehydrogenase/5,10-methylene-tetrahydrofolate cyclohydrolase [Patescibacteria group bacterium]|nr:bifunctional 5,10-methylene-tetrahydrofolate dehydrogenase/5,10-methylene-tetrahydrofolate cyclohydrolase [Patescibacteria group bacterium]